MVFSGAALPRISIFLTLLVNAFYIGRKIPTNANGNAAHKNLQISTKNSKKNKNKKYYQIDHCPRVVYNNHAFDSSVTNHRLEQPDT